MQLAIILTSKYRLLSLAAIVDVFETANRLLREDGQPDKYQIHFVGPSATKAIPEGIAHIPYLPIATAQHYDLIFVPAFGSVDLAQTVMENSCCFPWQHKQYAHDDTLASNSNRDFLLSA